MIPRSCPLKRTDRRHFLLHCFVNYLTPDVTPGAAKPDIIHTLCILYAPNIDFDLSGTDST